MKLKILTGRKEKLTKARTRLCLGTAKLSDPNYGHGSSLPHDTATIILDAAHECQIDWLDTSPRYGVSEQQIGRYSPQGSKFCISSKIDGLMPSQPDIAKKMHDSVRHSLAALKTDKLDLLYLHQHDVNIIQDSWVQDGLRDIREKGLTTSIGASVYTQDEIDAVLESPIFEWIQVAANILDTSIISYIRKYAPEKKIAVRSIYLQGLILNSAKIGRHIPEYQILENTIKEIEELLSQNGVDIEEATISFMVNEIEPEMVIFGTSVGAHVRRFNDAAQIKLKASLVGELRQIAAAPKSWTNLKLWM